MPLELIFWMDYKYHKVGKVCNSKLPDNSHHEISYPFFKMKKPHQAGYEFNVAVCVPHLYCLGGHSEDSQLKQSQPISFLYIIGKIGIMSQICVTHKLIMQIT
ncbi:hypothetical protein ACP275_14G316900 [Erythranthe tilingii]